MTLADHFNYHNRACLEQHSRILHWDAPHLHAASTEKTLVLHGEISPHKIEKLLFPVQPGNDSAQPSASDLTGEKTAIW